MRSCPTPRVFQTPRVCPSPSVTCSFAQEPSRSPLSPTPPSPAAFAARVSLPQTFAATSTTPRTERSRVHNANQVTTEKGKETLTCPRLIRGLNQSRQLQTLPTGMKPRCEVSGEHLHRRKTARREIGKVPRSDGGTGYALFPPHLLSPAAAVTSPALSNGK